MVSNDDIQGYTQKEYILGDTSLFNNSAVKYIAFPVTYAMVKQLTCSLLRPTPVSIRISYEVMVSYSTGATNIFKNGVAHGTAQATGADSAYHLYEEDLTFEYGDIIDVRAEGNCSGFHVKNMLIKGFLIEPNIELFTINQ